MADFSDDKLNNSSLGLPPYGGPLVSPAPQRNYLNFPEPCRVCAVLEKENAWLRAQVEIYRDQVASLADPLVLARVRVSVPSAQPTERKPGPRRLLRDELNPIERQQIEQAESPTAASIEASFSSTEGS